MAEEVFRRFGGAAGRRLEAGGRCIFMSLALEQVKEHLKFYRRKAETTDMISMLLAISEELKLCAVRPRTLGQAGRISGVTPAALTCLEIHLKKRSLLG